MIALPNPNSWQSKDLVSWWPLGTSDTTDAIAFDRGAAKTHLVQYNVATTVAPGKCFVNSRVIGRSSPQHYYCNTGGTSRTNSLLSAAKQATLAFWFYPITAPSFMALLGNANHTAGGQYITTYVDYALKLTCATFGSGGQLCVEAGTIPTGQWHFVVATAGAGGVRLYRNGANTATNTLSPVFSAFNQNWYIGGTGLNGTAYQLNGNIFDCRVYAREFNQSEAMAMSANPWELWTQPQFTFGKRAAATIYGRRRRAA